MADSSEVVVGIATYNNVDTIDRTMEMVLGQTRPPDRLVFCDKSTDGTREQIESYADSDRDTTIEVIGQSGDGVADAYDEILNHIQGEYDVFATVQTDLIVDDEWLEDHLDVHAEHPEIDMVMGDYKGNEPTDREVEPDERPYYVGRNFSAKAGVLERIDGWDPNFLRGEDWDMRIRLAGAGTRVYAKTELGYEWQQGTDDPYVTLSKAKRKPTSVTFLSKYGPWYARFHPSHVISDGLSLASVLGAVGTVGFLSVSPTLAALSAIVFSLSVVVYWVAHLALRGGVDEDVIVGPTRKQLLNGIAVLYAYNRVVRGDVDWNTSGFDPENIPRYKF
ncbi:glycosyltransferase family 2 protein [Halarchaeum sp. P4]|uniref:glycosyltransferase family 2 protein n=1 Tax=Halarchaeum sp. P4 TaxID=3421639 RepID=UPI003EB92AA4